MKKINFWLQLTILALAADYIRACSHITYIQCKSKANDNIACVRSTNGKCSPKSIWEDYQSTTYATLSQCKATLCDPAVDCSGNGQCSAGGGCECNDHYYGDACETYCNPTDNCMGNRTCTASGECDCANNYFGADCDAFCSSTETCSNHGTCNSNGLCACAENYFTADCSVYCLASETCHGHGTCNSTDGKCDCEEGFIGDFCGKYFLHPKMYLYYDRSEAEAACRAVGAELAEIRGQRDSVAVADFVLQSTEDFEFGISQFWIGLKLDQNTGERVWSGSGEALDYGEFDTSTCEESPGVTRGRSKLQSRISSAFDNLNNMISSRNVPYRVLTPRVDESTGPCDCALISDVFDGTYSGSACAMSSTSIMTNQIPPIGYALCQTFGSSVPPMDRFNGSTLFFALPPPESVATIYEYADLYLNNTVCSEESGSVPIFNTAERLTQMGTYAIDSMGRESMFPLFLFGLVSEDSMDTWHWADNTPLDTSLWLSDTINLDYFASDFNQTNIRFCGIYFMIVVFGIPCDVDFDGDFSIPISDPPYAICEF